MLAMAVVHPTLVQTLANPPRIMKSPKHLCMIGMMKQVMIGQSQITKRISHRESCVATKDDVKSIGKNFAEFKKEMKEDNGRVRNDVRSEVAEHKTSAEKAMHDLRGEVFKKVTELESLVKNDDRARSASNPPRKAGGST